jgi:hypothetical protein
MKRAALPAAALTIALLALTVALGATDSGPSKRLVSGEVVSLYAYLAQGLRGVENRDASVFQIEQRGLPVAIVEDGTNEIYVAVYKGPTSAAAKLAPYMGLEVNVQGPVFEKSGLKLIEIQVVAEQ